MLENDEDEQEHGVSKSNIDDAKQNGIFSRRQLGLTDEEFFSSASVKYLMDRADSYGAEIRQLKSFETNFYESSKEIAVLKTQKENLEKQILSKKEFENTQKFMITIGGALLGSIKWLGIQSWYGIGFCSILGIGLIICAIFPCKVFGGK